MIAAISQRRSIEQSNSDSLEESYADYFNLFGIELIPIPNNPNTVMNYFLDNNIEGIILSGGGDVHPRYYGGSIDQTNANYSVERDEVEKKMLGLATLNNLPVLGICRGMQAINIYFGGDITQSLAKEAGGNIQHAGSRHNIKIIEDTLLELLDSDLQETNSYHNSGILEPNLSPLLIPFAKAPDDTIEGIYSPNAPIAATIWHPEREITVRPVDKLLVEAFKARDLFWEGAR